jgi:hypothetical protein
LLSAAETAGGADLAELLELFVVRAFLLISATALIAF